MFPSHRRLVSTAFVTLGLLGGLTTPAMAETPCSPSATALCLNGFRFKLEATAQTLKGEKLSGNAISLTPNAGAFWFESPDSLDVAVKILDGTAISGKLWVIYGGLTSLKYSVVITDTTTGDQRTYTNPPESGADFFAFTKQSGDSSELPTCDFVPANPHVGDPVKFFGGYSGPAPRQWFWRFGDEPPNANYYSSADQNPSHTYTLPSANQLKVLLKVDVHSSASTIQSSIFCTPFLVKPACKLVVTPTGDLSSLSAAGGTGPEIMVSTAEDCEWSVTSNPPAYLKITSPSTGKKIGSGSVNFKLDPNNSLSPRSGTLTFRLGPDVVQTLFLSQKGVKCDFTLTPSQVALGPAGRSGTLTIRPNVPACRWSAAGSDCVTLLGATQGTGVGQLSYKVCPNPSTSSRQVALTVEGKPFVVSQAGCHAFTGLTSPQEVEPTQSFPFVLVDADSPVCAWDAKTDGTFLNLLSTKPFSGARGLNLYVVPNYSSLSRTDSLTIAAQKIQYVQKGCSSVSTNLVDLDSGAIGTVQVSATPYCLWLAESNASFIHIQDVKPAGSGKFDVTFYVDDDAGGVERLGALSVAGQIVIVRQKGAPPPAACAQLTGPDVAGMFNALGGVGHLSVNTTSPEICKWQVGTTATHLKIRKDNANAVSFCAAANRSGLRGGRMALTQTSGLSKQPSPGASFFDVLQTAPDGGDPTLPCSNKDPGVLCLREGRFEVRATFGDVPNLRQAAQAVGVTGSSGYFWVFDPTNPELVVKVVDDQPNGSFQVYSGGLSSLPYTLTVTDTTTGKQAFFCNLDNSFQSFNDTTTFTAEP